MEVPSTLFVVPLVVSLPQPLEATLVEKELVPTTNDDKQGQVDYYGRAHGRRHGQRRGGAHVNP